MRILNKELIKRFLLPFYRPTLLPSFTPPIYFQLKALPKSTLARVIYGSLAWNYELNVIERVAEIPFVFQNIGLPKGSKVLDFGCNESPVCMHLASLGYSVVGVDIQPYPFTHPNFKFVQGDFLDNGFSENEFDAAVAISAIEHCGLGAYGDSRLDQGDVQVVREVHRILRPGGRFLITVPFGSPGQTSWYRVYDDSSLKSLLSSFNIVSTEYYVGVGRKSWTPASLEEVAAVDSVECGFAQGAACVVAVKP